MRIVFHFCPDCPEPSVEVWRDSSGCHINFPVPCVQTALCSISGEVQTYWLILTWLIISEFFYAKRMFLFALPLRPQEYLLGLTDRSHLYAGDTEVCCLICFSSSQCVRGETGRNMASGICVHLCLLLSQLASNVSSFAICNDFLLITTHSHTCRCLQLSTLTVKGKMETH